MSEATSPSLRLFVPAEAIVDGRLELEGSTANRAYMRGARAGGILQALDGRGWAHDVLLDHAGWDALGGKVVGRRLAPEPRTKISLHHGLLAPAETRRLVFAASAAGVISYGPLITDRSVVPSLYAAPGVGPTAVHSEGEVDLAGLALEASEIAGRGRCPALREPALFDRALDESARAGETIVLAELAPEPELPAPLLELRPFALSLMCPPPDGFSEDELSRATARGALRLAIPEREGYDPAAQPLRLALEALDRLFDALEPKS